MHLCRTSQLQRVKMDTIDRDFGTLGVLWQAWSSEELTLVNLPEGFMIVKLHESK